MQVSWVRQRDLHILTVGTYTYTSDQRFHSIHLEGSEDWTLEVRYTQKWDAGVYECQVSTEPKMSLNISLAVVVAKARIPEGSNLYIQSGNTINLTCVVTDSRAPPVYVFWYHDDRMINYDSARRAGIRVATERGPSTTVSRLQVPDATTGDSGNYSCIPSYADPANITVHVLNGEKPAAMQHGRQGNLAERSLSSLLLVTGVLLSHRLFYPCRGAEIVRCFRTPNTYILTHRMPGPPFIVCPRQCQCQLHRQLTQADLS
ncbi:hypothetical protein HPB47_005317 [Ixodes persulcatus]|uniref:Uncharacterized protein n=1 Tax=Ixodes persulcatus TaxID=34615 RepID=A0AC60PDG2_IXOPE|nr:hypothetical protein HPB47_005317 [Ixodes persulcatus]